MVLTIAGVTAALAAASSNPVLTARLLWVLAQLGAEGQATVTPFLSHENPQIQITAYRALRLAGAADLLERAKILASSPSAAVRREVALSLRDTPYTACADILAPLFAGYDGLDRYYLEAIGIAATLVVAAWEGKLDRETLNRELNRGPAYVEALEAAGAPIVEQSTEAAPKRAAKPKA